MEVQRLSDEKVLLDKQYAKGNQKSSCELTVTNKRVIHSFRYKKGSETTEFKVEDIEGCCLDMKRGSPFGTLLIIIGIMTLIGAVINLVMSGAVGEGMPKDLLPMLSGMLIGGCVLLIVGVILCRKINMFIVVYADAMENPMFCCSVIKGKSKTIRLNVNKDSAREIINDLNNAVCNARAESEQA